MSNQHSNESAQQGESSLDQPLDLSVLESLNFGPNWSDSTAQLKKKHEPRGDRGAGGPGGGPRDRRDRRPARPGGGGGPNRGGDRDAGPSFREDRRGGGERGGGGRGPRGPREGGEDRRQGGRRSPGGGARERRPFRPTVEVSLYPEDGPFKVLTKAIRQSYRTFELFEIAQLILEKPERFVVVVRPPSQNGEQAHPLYLSTPDQLPFEDEESALQHAVSKYFLNYFDVEETEVEPPKGAFQLINRCKRTGELLGPPNYHRYQQLLQEHHATHFPNLPYHLFLENIEADRSQEAIDEWTQKMTKQTRYLLKSDPSRVFETAESARQHLWMSKREELVKASDSARFSGKEIENLPRGNIRSSVESVLEHQRHFPLDTANHLRSRLRRLHFAIYKRGSKGVSYVCAVKRQFRAPDQTFGESVQKLIDFIEANPNLPTAELPEKYLGIKIPEAKKAPSEPTPEGPAEKPTESAEVATTEEAASEAAPEASDMSAEAPTEAQAVEETPVAEEAAPPAETPKPKPATKEDPLAKLTPEEQDQVRRMSRDLRWLVMEGYVTEMADGKLFAPPPQAPQTPKPKPEKAAKEDPAVPQEATGDIVPEASQAALPATEEAAPTESGVVVAEAGEGDATASDATPDAQQPTEEAEPPAASLGDNAMAAVSSEEEEPVEVAEEATLPESVEPAEANADSEDPLASVAAPEPEQEPATAPSEKSS